MAAMMASMAVGGVVGQNIAGAMNNMMGGMNQASQMGTVPPPVPTVAFHIAVDGQATGPFNLTTLSQMTLSGQLSKESLVWKPGMTEWTQAGMVKELQGMFGVIPPIPKMP